VHGIPKQNLESKLNKYLNEAIYPIIVFVRYPDHRFRYMGEFMRLPKYDCTFDLYDKDVYSFGLVSKNIDTVENIICEILSFTSHN